MKRAFVVGTVGPVEWLHDFFYAFMGFLSAVPKQLVPVIP